MVLLEGDLLVSLFSTKDYSVAAQPRFLFVLMVLCYNITQSGDPTPGWTGVAGGPARY